MFKSRTGKEFEFNDDILVTSPGKRFWLRRKYSVSPTWNLGNSNILATWCKELTLLKRPWGWERLRAGGEGDDQGWDGWMASPTQWTWVWVNSRSWWWIGGPGMLQSMGSQRVRHDWVTELNWTEVRNHHFFKNMSVRSVESYFLRPHGLNPARLCCLWNFTDKILEWVHNLCAIVYNAL